MDGRDLLAGVITGVLEGVLADTDGGVACDDLKALDDAGVHDVLQPAVLAFGVLADGDDIDVRVQRVHTWHGHTRANVRVEPKLLTQGEVERAVTLADGRGHGALEPEAIAADRVERLGGDEVVAGLGALDVDVMLLPRNWHVCSREHSLHRVCDLRPDAVTWEQRYCVVRLRGRRRQRGWRRPRREVSGRGRRRKAGRRGRRRAQLARGRGKGAAREAEARLHGGERGEGLPA